MKGIPLAVGKGFIRGVFQRCVETTLDRFFFLIRGYETTFAVIFLFFSSKVFGIYLSVGENVPKEHPTLLMSIKGPYPERREKHI